MGTTDQLITEAIKQALHLKQRKHLELWRTVSARYPDIAYPRFDALMGALEMDEVIQLTGCRGPNTYKLANQ